MKSVQAFTALASIVGALLSATQSVEAHGPGGGHFHIADDLSRRYEKVPQHKIRTPSAVGNVDTAMYLKQRAARSLPAHFGKRASPQGKTEGSAAQVENSQEECSPYDVTAIDDILPHFPQIWDVATIVKGDTEATAAFAAINASGLVPTNLAIHGTQPASLLGTGLDTGYDVNKDPGCWWTDTRCSTPKHPGLLNDVTTCPEPHTWGNTQDDGPNCTHNALYDFWEKNDQKVSLFYIGSNIMDWPLEAQRGIADGHHICVHTWSHRYMTALTDEQAFAELWYTTKAIKSVMGVTPTCWRPPFGDVDDRIRGIAQGLGLRTIIWNADTFDWQLAPAGDVTPAQLSATYSSIIAQATTTGETGGVIVLEHELDDNIMNFTMKEYPAVKAAWKYVVPLSACLNLTQPYGEKEYVYPDFAEYIAGTTMPQGLPTSSIAIDTTGTFTAQGTLSGQAGNMPTAQAGGPDNSAAVNIAGSGTTAAATSSGARSGSASASGASSSGSQGASNQAATSAASQSSTTTLGLAWIAMSSLAVLVASALVL